MASKKHSDLDTKFASTNLSRMCRSASGKSSIGILNALAGLPLESLEETSRVKTSSHCKEKRIESCGSDTEDSAMLCLSS